MSSAWSGVTGESFGEIRLFRRRIKYSDVIVAPIKAKDTFACVSVSRTFDWLRLGHFRTWVDSMYPWLLLAFALPSSAALDKTHGVPPSLVSKYVPSTTGARHTWTCLDGSKQIAWSAVNDDYCDCADGSDEPGASPGGSGQVIRIVLT
jgi:hypothetical protein